ncbi:MAG: restriction endonuclease subunit S [Kofleriaceae bacterium]|nr:restriction endonuclease subunit S [Kofleriaceae bacterium]MBP9166709.1 restriction endonuclease subunit S [Kofleriaceae bacterium]MBP9861649.1 restriction endonuclease subunit S [Kofleriaceae bacterium]
MSDTYRPFGEVIQYIRGVTFEPSELVDPRSPGAVACMRTKNIQDVLSITDLIAVPTSTVRRDELYLRPGDMLISSANSWELVGKACAVPALPYKATAGGFIAILRTRGVLDPRYMAHWVTAPSTQLRIRRCARKTTNIANLAVPQLEALPVPVPPANEQRRIADLLDKADAIRRKRQEAIALTDDLLRSTFLEMFGDLSQWPTRPFAELVSESLLGLVRAAAEQGPDRAHPYVRMNAIRPDGALDLTNLTRVDASAAEAERYRLCAGDFLFNTRNSRELVGKSAVYHSDEDELIVFNNNILRIRFSPDVLPDFVSSYWQTAMATRELEKRKAGTTSVFAIYFKNLATLPVPVPPLSIQRAYTRACEASRTLQREYRSHAGASATLASRLQRDAFER